MRMIDARPDMRYGFRNGRPDMNAQPKKATNLTLDASLIEEARTLDVNLSRAAEEGLRVAVRQARADRWRAENAEALASSNAWVEQHGLPLARYRAF
jgi:antitoxin CcdA